MDNKNTGVIDPNNPENSHEIEPAARLTDKAIAVVKEQMDLAEKLVATMMKFGIDYGITPGTQGPGLWDAGASKVMRAFRVFPDHKILYHEENDEIVSYVIQVHLMTQAGEIFGSGMGAASTRETKYKYRWVKKDDAIREGYTEEDIAGLKTKAGFNNEVLYRIENPEYGELVNTILAMASKRAEVDAARGLPGVGSALKVKFNEKPGDKKSPAGQMSGQEDLTLPVFWSMVKGAGLTEDDVHRTLNVKSLKDWRDSGKTYRSAVEYIMKIAIGAARSVKKAPQSSSASAGQKSEPKEKTAKQITKEDVPDVDALLALAMKFWQMEEGMVWSALGFSDRDNFKEAQIQTPWEAFEQLQLKIEA
jgi:hypothetical protein